MKRILILTLTNILLLSSCKKEEITENNSHKEEDSVQTVEQAVEATSDDSLTIIEPPIQTIQYSFVVMHYKTSFERGVVTTGIFETHKYLSEDEKYRILDNAQDKAKYNWISGKMTKRELKSYDSYAEASKARERFLK